MGEKKATTIKEIEEKIFQTTKKNIEVVQDRSFKTEFEYQGNFG